MFDKNTEDIKRSLIVITFSLWFTSEPVAKKTKKRTVGDVTQTTTSSPDKKIAKLNNTSGMSNYDTGSNLNIT